MEIPVLVRFNDAINEFNWKYWLCRRMYLGGYLRFMVKLRWVIFNRLLRIHVTLRNQSHKISQSMNMLQSTAAAAERVFEFLASEEEVAEVENPVAFEDVQGQVTFENVCFGYDPSKIVINNFRCISSQAKQPLL